MTDARIHTPSEQSVPNAVEQPVAWMRRNESGETVFIDNKPHWFDDDWTPLYVRPNIENTAAKWANEAAEDIESWAGYASAYFQEKHDLAGTLKKWRDRALSAPSAIGFTHRYCADCDEYVSESCKIDGCDMGQKSSMDRGTNGE